MTGRSRVALVTARIAAPTDADLPPLLDALSDAGLAADAPCWDDPAVDWSRYRLAILRSPWDYVPRYGEFLDWLDRTALATTVLNRPEVVRWNTDKRYLRDLASRGVPVVPTTFHEPGAPPPPLDRLLEPATDGDLVVKPVVSAGSKDTMRHSSRSAALDHVQGLLAAGRAVMVQPYQAAVDGDGETGLVSFDGNFSHAFRKGPILRRDAAPTDEFFAPEEITARDPSPAERAVAEAALAASPPDLLYARVDLVPGRDGNPVVLELELAEPSYFVSVAPQSAARFAACVAARLP
jgi:glutathione synthase/RimK-type ligase-like ATP-grasp enzyme